MIYRYARVSTDGQSVVAHVEQLRAAEAEPRRPTPWPTLCEKSEISNYSFG
jgi:hypothetical protein